jgi:hypothetical protein
MSSGGRPSNYSASTCLNRGIFQTKKYRKWLLSKVNVSFTGPVALMIYEKPGHLTA